MGRQQFWKDFEAGQHKYTPIKWFFQRLFRGYDDRDVFDLSGAIERFVYPRLAHFVEWQVEHGKTCPDDLDPAEWLNVLNKMNAAFEILDKYDGSIWMEEEEEPVVEGLFLFGKYLTDLRA